MTKNNQQNDKKKPRTQPEMIAKESSSGCRYSVLLELEYFDSPRFLVVDPMHNLFLGTAKHHLKRVCLNRFKGELMLSQ